MVNGISSFDARRVPHERTDLVPFAAPVHGLNEPHARVYGQPQSLEVGTEIWQAISQLVGALPLRNGRSRHTPSGVAAGVETAPGFASRSSASGEQVREVSPYGWFTPHRRPNPSSCTCPAPSSAAAPCLRR